MGQAQNIALAVSIVVIVISIAFLAIPDISIDDWFGTTTLVVGLVAAGVFGGWGYFTGKEQSVASAF